MVSLNDIEVMIHCHCTPTPHERADAMAVKGAYNMFLAQGMIIPDERIPGVYRSTEKGAFWLEALCGIPFPVESYFIPSATHPGGE